MKKNTILKFKIWQSQLIQLEANALGYKNLKLNCGLLPRPKWAGAIFLVDLICKINHFYLQTIRLSLHKEKEHSELDTQMSTIHLSRPFNNKNKKIQKILFSLIYKDIKMCCGHDIQGVKKVILFYFYT